ncbi:hypothetical protein K438DRAFT_1775814 [Mycena galopus ATCC 62051]|nr:hypothetical protein K438DRAFT_1775814 [Mycena galopus ATCC 62051]
MEMKTDEWAYSTGRPSIKIGDFVNYVHEKLNTKCAVNTQALQGTHNARLIHNWVELRVRTHQLGRPNEASVMMPSRSIMAIYTYVQPILVVRTGSANDNRVCAFYQVKGFGIKLRKWFSVLVKLYLGCCQTEKSKKPPSAPDGGQIWPDPLSIQRKSQVSRTFTGGEDDEFYLKINSTFRTRPKRRSRQNVRFRPSARPARQPQSGPSKKRLQFKKDFWGYRRRLSKLSKVQPSPANLED